MLTHELLVTSAAGTCLQTLARRLKRSWKMYFGAVVLHDHTKKCNTSVGLRGKKTCFFFRVEGIPLHLNLKFLRLYKKKGFSITFTQNYGPKGNKRKKGQHYASHPGPSRTTLPNFVFPTTVAGHKKSDFREESELVPLGF